MTRYDLLHLIKFLEEAPGNIELQVVRLDNVELRQKPAPGEFSALEHIYHLADIEQEGYSERIERLLKEDEPFLEDIDGDRLAVERDYNSKDLGTALRRFSNSRKQNLHMIRDLTLDDLKRSGVLEKVGRITLHRLLIAMLQHDGEHLRALSELRCRFDTNAKT